MGGRVLSERAMARLRAVVRALALALLAALCRAEDDAEMLHIAERALCAASHSRIARTGPIGTVVADHKAAGSCSPPGYNVFLIFGVRPCSGVLISEQHVITSAYCTEHAHNGTAFLGGHKYQSLADLKLPEVKLAVVMEFYYFNNSDLYLDHDVAIGRLNRKFEQDSTITHAQLTSLSTWDEPSEGTLMGFGETFEGDSAHELRSGTAMLECGAMCSSYVNTYNLGENALCGTNTTYAMCWGDMGGAVVDADGKLVGLISYKVIKTPTFRFCTVPATHTFFMFIGYYRDWIQSIINPTRDI